MIKFNYLTCFLLFVIFVACEMPFLPSSHAPFVLQDSASHVPYDLHRPDSILKLSIQLREISGLGINRTEYLYAINDEVADLFLLNKQNSTIEHQIDFGKRGDYEGVEMVGNTAYIVKSNGTIYEFALDEQETPAIKYDTALKLENDVEGLAYDKQNHSLLLACKGKAMTKTKGKAVYGFDLEAKELSLVPVFLITKKAILAFLEPSFQKQETKATTIYSLKKRATSFAPSGIALHPQTGAVYILSSVGKTLFILNSLGEIEHIHFLQKRLFPQPEGICFDANGTLYISSEGAGGKGRILRFAEKK